VIAAPGRIRHFDSRCRKRGRDLLLQFPDIHYLSLSPPPSRSANSP
jgi:hypothetical protein